MTAEESLQRFLTHLRHHLRGWRAKVEKDFSEKNFKLELEALAADPVYSKFHLASPDYVVIRLICTFRDSVSLMLPVPPAFRPSPGISACSGVRPEPPGFPGATPRAARPSACPHAKGAGLHRPTGCGGGPPA